MCCADRNSIVHDRMFYRVQTTVPDIVILPRENIINAICPEMFLCVKYVLAFGEVFVSWIESVVDAMAEMLRLIGVLELVDVINLIGEWYELFCLVVVCFGMENVIGF